MKIDNPHKRSETDVSNVKEKLSRYIARRGLDAACRVRVDKKSRWFVLKGKVNSARTKAGLFKLIPEEGGARWIVDQVQVGRLHE